MITSDKERIKKLLKYVNLSKFIEDYNGCRK